MHQLGIVHRDIRPCNIWYVSRDKQFKLGGFDEAKIIENFIRKK
jgi:serine/threonine protein kinase